MAQGNEEQIEGQLGPSESQSVELDPAITFEDCRVCYCFREAVPCEFSLGECDEFQLGTFQLRRITNSGSKFEEVTAPIRWWSNTNRFIFGNGWIDAVSSIDGRVFLVFADVDGRVCVMEWDGPSTLHLITHSASPYVFEVVVGMGRLAFCVWVAPMLLLLLLSGFVGSVPPRCIPIADAARLIVFASAFRRGAARGFDLSILLLPVVASIVWHPDVFVWCRHSFEQVQRLAAVHEYWRFDPTIGSLANVVVQLRVCILTVVLVPMTSLWLVLAGLLLAGQITWQATQGRTIGKALLSIRVLRSDLRRCGFVRSCVREIAVLLDSVVLLTWLPGVVAIVATTRHQRLGDLLADTVVVRDSAVDRN